jgi:hypothetical protein
MEVTSIPILTIIIFLPLLGALAVAIAPASAARPVALGFALVTWVVSLFLLLGYLPDGDTSSSDGRLDPVLASIQARCGWAVHRAGGPDRRCRGSQSQPASDQTRIENMISFLVLEVGGRRLPA